jgi:hypothetical protein
MNKHIALNPTEVKLTSGDYMQSTHTATVDIPALLIAVREAHIFPNHFQHSLLSVGQLCDNTFLSPQHECYSYDELILVGQRDHETGLWTVNITTSPPGVNPMPQAVYAVYKQRSTIEDSIAYLYAACFIPVKDTWLNATEAGNCAGWPDLMPDRVHNYLQKSDTTVKGHMSQQQQTTTSMQEKESQVDTEPSVSQEDNTGYIFADVVESGQIYSELTGQSPTTSSRGKTYVLFIYVYSPSIITTEPMKNRGDT